jgi:NAD(P)-dependent dehydrogenase (short-subunit alcohol dehydrogenase family)
MSSLRGRIALVAGATRGAGRGIAAALGEAGATVVCTGRCSRTGALRSDYAGRRETIEETAELVTRLGGVGIAKPVDHLDAARVQRLAEELRAEHGRIDVLVHDIWGAEVLKGPVRARSWGCRTTPAGPCSWRSRAMGR